MNLTIGLSISNIQDLRKNADGLRLVKEVLLQRYLESLLRLVSTLPLCGLLWKNCVLANLGQLVLADIYNCNAIYTLQNIDRMYDNTLEPKLTLIQKARFATFFYLFFVFLKNRGKNANYFNRRINCQVPSKVQTFVFQRRWPPN